MEIYETGLMPTHKAAEFAMKFDRLIGTDREINYPESDARMAYVVCFELTPAEVDICREIETNI